MSTPIDIKASFTPGLYCCGNCVQVQNMTRSLLSFLRLWPLSPIDRRVVVANRDDRSDWQQQKLKIIRRDRYRCRGCDKRGDEVSLGLHPIQPEFSNGTRMLALCANCQRLANANGLKG